MSSSLKWAPSASRSPLSSRNIESHLGSAYCAMCPVWRRDSHSGRRPPWPSPDARLRARTSTPLITRVPSRTPPTSGFKEGIQREYKKTSQGPLRGWSQQNLQSKASGLMDEGLLEVSSPSCLFPFAYVCFWLVNQASPKSSGKGARAGGSKQPKSVNRLKTGPDREVYEKN
eukprot:scaffold23306_cov125-Isochrysis_galbana.AAC.13